MLADIVNNQVDFTTLQTLTPQLNSFNPNEAVSADRKSFEDMIRDVRQTKEKPVEKSEQSQKVDDSAEKEKVQDSEKFAETSKTEDKSEEAKVSENNDFISDKSDKTAVNVEVKKDAKQIETKNHDNKEVSKEEKNHSLTKNEEFSFNNLERLIENSKENTVENELTVNPETIKNLTKDSQEELAATVAVSEQLIKQNSDVSYEYMEQLSENLFDSSEEEFDVKAKSFSLDKNGKITVKDLRSEKNDVEIQDKAEKNTLKVTDVKFDGKNNAEMTLEVASNVQQNITSSNNQTASAAGSNFQAMLSNQIQQNAGEFVKAGNIVLKDNDVGSIKLILKPEQLGNVKIDLQINDKSITGRIIVASQEAYNAFKESAESLKQAFINSGFESAGLDLSFAGQNNSGNQMSNQENPAKSFAMARSYGDFTDSEVSGEFEQDEILSNSLRNSVNIVA